MLRLDRLTSILIQLQSKRIVRAQEIADRFEISLRTVYRDVRTLEQAGVPILSEAGIGYSILKEYRLPPVHFTDEEAMSFLTAEKLVAQFTDPNTRKAYESALYKIKAVLGMNEKEKIDDASDHIAVLQNAWIPKDRHDNLNIQEILEAILSRKVIRLKYFSGAMYENTERIIEPAGIYAQGPYWYLIAWCRLRSDYRNFRTDRFVNFEVLTERFQTQHPQLSTFIEQTSKQKEVQKVIIRIDKSDYRYLGDQKYYMGFVSEKESGNQIELTFLSSSLTGFSLWFLYLGASADIIEPILLKELVSQQILKIVTRLEK